MSDSLKAINPHGRIFFSWEINYIERKRSSSLVSSLLLWTKFDLFYIFFLINSYYYLPFYLLCKSHHHYCNYVSLEGIIRSFSIKKRTKDSFFIIIIIMFACLDFSEISLPTVSTLLADEA